MYGLQNGWTKESMIEHVKNNFKGKSYTGAGPTLTCLYRGPEGKKCAVGLFIPDDKYHKDMDDGTKGTNATLVIERHNLDVFMPLNYKGMTIFQGTHDSLNEKLNLEEQTDILVNWIIYNVKEQNEK